MHTSDAKIHEFEVLEVSPAAEGVCRMLASAPSAAAELLPGQFVNIAVPNNASHILRIPLSFAQADAKSGIIELVFALVGEGTQRLAAMRPGDASTLLAPLGNGWSFEGFSRALLVAGGIGLPPVVAAARWLAAHDIGFDAIVGARSASLIWQEGLDELRRLTPSSLCDCARRVLVATDDGTAGVQGLVTQPLAELLAERAYDAVLACGPAPMLAGVAAASAEAGVSCQVSLERMMGCGFGACSCCNVEKADGSNALCCKDGPVFDAKELAW